MSFKLKRARVFQVIEYILMNTTRHFPDISRGRTQLNNHISQQVKRRAASV